MENAEEYERNLHRYLNHCDFLDVLLGRNVRVHVHGHDHEIHHDHESLNNTITT